VRAGHAAAHQTGLGSLSRADLRPWRAPAFKRGGMNGRRGVLVKPGFPAGGFSLSCRDDLAAAVVPDRRALLAGLAALLAAPAASRATGAAWPVRSSLARQAHARSADRAGGLDRPAGDAGQGLVGRTITAALASPGFVPVNTIPIDITSITPRTIPAATRNGHILVDAAYVLAPDRQLRPPGHGRPRDGPCGPGLSGPRHALALRRHRRLSALLRLRPRRTSAAPSTRPATWLARLSAQPPASWTGSSGAARERARSKPPMPTCAPGVRRDRHPETAGRRAAGKLWEALSGEQARGRHGRRRSAPMPALARPSPDHGKTPASLAPQPSPLDQAVAPKAR